MPCMASYARKIITADENEVASYLLTNRIVRQSWLCGKDPATGKDFSHRKKWFEDRTQFLISRCFFLEMHSYVVMDNHYHCVVTTRPDLAKAATNDDIVQRWWELYPRRINGEIRETPPQELIDLWISDDDWLAERRKRLSSISWFMARLAEYIARKANKEDGAKGRFWEGRFDSRILLDQDAIVSANVYVDLNPVKADASTNPTEDSGTSIRIRKEQLKKTGTEETPFRCLYNDSKRPSGKSDQDLMPFYVEPYVDAIQFIARSQVPDEIEPSMSPFYSGIYYNPALYPLSIGPSSLTSIFASRRKARRSNVRRTPKSDD